MRAAARPCLVLSSLLVSSLLLATLPFTQTARAERSGLVPARSPAFASKRLCAGVRGNGPRIWAHFGSLAQIVGSYRTLDAVSGGSSGSITALFAESIQLNPLVHRCGGRPCSRRETAARVSLQWKSLQALTQAGLGGDIGLLLEIGQRIEDEGILELLQEPGTVAEGLEALKTVLSELGPLLNPEIPALLATSPNPAFHAVDIITATEKALNFIVDDSLVFVRPGILNWEQLAKLFGRIASFYAGYGPYDAPGAAAFLDACALPSLDQDWDHTAALPAGDSSCGQAFIDLFDAYSDAFDLDTSRNRLDDPIGASLPSLVVTGVIVGSGVPKWEEARVKYWNATPEPLVVDFDTEVGFGYLGNVADLRVVERRLARRQDDLQSAKFVNLGPATWRVALTSSPAEPGLSSGVPLPDGSISVGGWADPLRVLVLDALRCRNTVAVNRPDGVGSFTTDLTELLGATPADLDALYDATDPDSSFSQGLAQAGGVWCADWDTPPQTDVEGLFEGGFNAPFVTDRRFFLRGRRAYPGASPDLDIFGCTPPE